MWASLGSTRELSQWGHRALETKCSLEQGQANWSNPQIWLSTLFISVHKVPSEHRKPTVALTSVSSSVFCPWIILNQQNVIRYFEAKHPSTLVLRTPVAEACYHMKTDERWAYFIWFWVLTDCGLMNTIFLCFSSMGNTAKGILLAQRSGWTSLLAFLLLWCSVFHWQ